MCVKWGLEWGSSNFLLLGIKFSVNLQEVENLNYRPKFKEIENIMNSWSNQVLSPIGKITIIKTLIISKLNHLFMALPNPNKTLLTNFTKNLCSFIWDNKPDKVKREVLTQIHNLGGLKMLDIDKYIKGLKLTWIRRLIRNNSKIGKLLSFSENIKLQQLFYLGPAKHIRNAFWQEVCSAWTELNLKQFPHNETDFISCNIWKNEKIKVGNQTIIYKEWTEKGIWVVNDLLNSEGKFMNYQTFSEIYNIRTNYLVYHGIVLAIKTYMKALKLSESDLYRLQGPLIPFNLLIFFKSPKGSKDMYNVLISNYINPKCEEKWSHQLNNNYNWKQIYNMSFDTTKSSKLQWFQYRIIHRIIGTNDFLFKIKVKQSDKCSFCKEDKETIEHIFWSCPKVSELWEQLNSWIFDTTQIELPLNLEIILFGILQRTEKNCVRNLILLLTKFYIYRTKMCEDPLNIVALKNYLKENLLTEKYIYFKNKPLQIANSCWDPWLPILT